MTKTRTLTAAAFLAAMGLLLYGPPAWAMDHGNWMVRARAIHVSPTEDSSGIIGMDGAGVSMDNNTTWEVDLSRFVTPHFSLELSVSDSSHEFSGTGELSAAGTLGDARLFSPTLTLQYRFTPRKRASAYVAAGVNYTHFHSVDSRISLEGDGGGVARMDVDDSFGLTGQVGVDVFINQHWSINFDVKYVQMSADTTFRADSDAATVNMDVNPWVSGVGVGFCF